MGYMKVVVTVTEVDEPGILTLSSSQPQVGAELTPTLTDDEAADTQADERCRVEVGKVPEQDLGLGCDQKCR